jgi:hypothetical protein
MTAPAGRRHYPGHVLKRRSRLPVPDRPSYIRRLSPEFQQRRVALRGAMPGSVRRAPRGGFAQRFPSFGSGQGIPHSS